MIKSTKITIKIRDRHEDIKYGIKNKKNEWEKCRCFSMFQLK